MSGSRYSYIAIIEKKGDAHLVRFPGFGVEGRGVREYGATLSFAADMLAEIVMDYQEKDKPLPEQTRREDMGGSTGSEPAESAGAREVVITADLGKYRSRIEKNEKKVYYEFENMGGRDDEGKDGNPGESRGLRAWWQAFRS